jgi:hypothetical protein
MLAASRLVRRITLFAIVVAVGGSLAGCGSKSLVENFTSKIQADDFQASGPITGSFKMAAEGMVFDITLSGTMKIKGKDNAQTMKMDMAATDVTPASSTTNESITVGDWSYSRSNGGDWTKEARSTTDDVASVIKTIVVTDKGVESHYGQQLHRLESSKPLDPKAFFSDMSGISDASLTLTFWAKDDGTPAGMVVAGTFKQDQGGTLLDVTISMDLAFESLSGVTVEAPSM